VPLALWIWRQYPTEIEADLLERGTDIADWHQGTRHPRGWLVLSSRRLLVLLAHLPERSAFKTALRDGDWPIDTQIAAETHKELAEFHAGHRPEGEREYSAFISPVQNRKRYAEIEAEAEFGAQQLDVLYDQLGWS
jgi:hypothetical protein